MRLHFRTYGEGPPLVILHGLFGSHDNWHGLSQQFGAHFRVYSVDLRNHGRSPHSSTMDYPAMAEDLNEFLETVVYPTDQASLAAPAATVSPPTVSVLGHSMGGKTAMEFALRHPERVERLIIADIAPRAYAASHGKIFQALLALDLSAYTTRQQLEEALAPDLPSMPLRRFLLKSLAHDPHGGFRWRMNLPGLHANYDRLGAALAPDRVCHKPALFLRGECSDYLRDEDLATVRQFFPQARFRTLAGATHWLHADAPGPFRQAVLDFLGIPT